MHQLRKPLGIFFNVLWAILFCGLLSPLRSAELRAAAGETDITPPVGHQLWGSPDRTGPSTGVLDRLHSRILLLKSDATSLAIVTLDLGRTFGPIEMARLRASVRRDSGVEHVIFSASHTHTGPTILNEKYIQPGSHRWELRTLDVIATTINELTKKTVPCRIGAGKGAAYIGYNRLDPVAIRNWMAFNGVRFLPTSPIDPIVQVLRIDNDEGKPLAIVVIYACHGVVLDSINSTKYSADWPGAMCRFVEKTMPGHPLCLFIQGGAGDINSRFLGQYRSARPGGYGVLVHQMQLLGQEIGREVVRVANQIRTEIPESPTLLVRDDHMTFRMRWSLTALKTLKAIPDYYQWLVTGRPIGYPPKELTLLITTVLINRRIAILTVPGEPFVDFQINFRARLPGLDTILAGYSNGYVGYIPTIRAAARDGYLYGATGWPTMLEVDAGDRIIDRGIINVYRMLGCFNAVSTAGRPASKHNHRLCYRISQ
jgi:hypothetical protein